MPYLSPLQPIVFPDDSGRPSVMHFRIVFTQHAPWLAIVELRQIDTSFPSPVTAAAARDQVFNRILEYDLRGLPISVVKLVATDHTGAFQYELTPDIHDYVDRGNRYKTSPERARRGRHVERIEIDPDNLIAGRVRVDTVHAVPNSLDSSVATALA